MSRGLELLRNISQDLPAIDSANQAALPQGKLRFLLEYPPTPDLNKERQRLINLLNEDSFELFPLPGDQTQPIGENDGEFGHFIVLQFPTLERTLSQRSLFDIGYALQDELGLMSAEPDLAERSYQDPEPPSANSEEQTEGVVRDAFTTTCWVDRDAPDNKRWALEAMRIPQAWALSGNRGEGIIIAQPDTGVAAHDALANANIRLDLGINLVEQNDSPTDPLNESAANAGHGTATSSVITCPESATINGAAPGATLVPIRCVDSVKIFDAVPVIAAINHARQIGSHVITMSLGGTPSRALKKAIKAAIASDIIVITAAGNCVKLVVWPARYSAVIGVGGSNIEAAPWRGTSSGSDVDISAPAELVWVARREPGDNQQDKIEGGQGTSFATALTASTAALWLAHHGRKELIKTASEAGLSLQSLFRQALQVTAQQPSGWQANEHGAGIVNAEALLKLAPQYILQQGQPKASEETLQPSSSEDLLLSQLDNTAEDSNNNRINIERFEREIGSIVLESARLGTNESSSELQESVSANQELSTTLLSFIEADKEKNKDSPLSMLQQGSIATPASRVSQIVEAATAQTLTNRKGLSRSALESSGNQTSNVIRIDAAGIKQLLDVLEKRIDDSPLASDSSQDSRDSLKREVLCDTEEMLHKFQTGNKISTNDVRSNTALEALVKMQGRPVIRLSEEPIDINDPALEEWAGKLAMVYTELPKLALSVGRIDADNLHQGTGFVVAPGLVMTNRHVVEGFAAPLPSANRPDRWLIERHATINFSSDGKNESSEFIIQDVLFSGPDQISGDPRINHDELDLALIRVEQSNSAGSALPPPLSLGQSVQATELNSVLFLIGYPAAPSTFPKDDNGRFRRDVVERIRQLFGMDFGRCYLSPGLVEQPVNHFAHGLRPISFTHDATSLGGSSGSCLFSFGSAMNVVGLHYGGDWLRANFAHDLAHISGQLIQLPALIEQIASSSPMSRPTIEAAINSSRIHDSVDLSAPGGKAPA